MKLEFIIRPKDQHQLLKDLIMGNTDRTIMKVVTVEIEQAETENENKDKE